MPMTGLVDWYFQRYDSPESAAKEATLLAKENPDKIYSVMESIGVAETPKAVYTTYEPPTNPVIGMDVSQLDQYKKVNWPLFNDNYIGLDRRGNKP